VKYVRGNFWPTAEVTDDADLNGHVRTWIDTVAHQRVHGTTRERPADRLRLELPQLHPLPADERLVPFLRDTRKVARDGFVAWEGAWYGVPWQWAGQLVQVAPAADTVTLWAGTQPLVVHRGSSSTCAAAVPPCARIAAMPTSRAIG
jgi:hypothetical protein